MPSSSLTPADPITRCQPLLGTLVEVSVPAEAAAAADAAFAAVRRVHRLMSFHEADSDLARLRAAPAGAVVAVDSATVAVLRLARSLYERTFGLFDVAVGRALVGSGFLPRAGVADLRDFPGRGGDIELVDDTHVRCRRRTLIDLGGIAKGYAVDCAVEALVARGVTEGLVNAGGDLRCFGARRWPVHLRDGDGTVTRALSLADRAIASSSNLYNRRRRGGRQWSPHLGRGRKPVLVDGLVSVVADRCILADAMTKVAMSAPDLAAEILGEDGGYVLADCEPAGSA